MADDEKEESSGIIPALFGGWWSFYFVRYLLGTITGFFLICLLLLAPESALNVKRFAGDFGSNGSLFQYPSRSPSLPSMRMEAPPRRVETVTKTLTVTTVVAGKDSEANEEQAEKNHKNQGARNAANESEAGEENELPKDVTIYVVWFGLALSFAFCYIASAPVFVLHATRFVFVVKSMPRILATAVLCCGLVLAPLPMFYYDLASGIFVIYTVGLLAIMQCSLIALSYLGNSKGLNTYRQLIKWRSFRKNKKLEERAKYIDDAVESYKHMREHGNAFLIFIFELLLTCILYNTEPRYLLVVVAIWVLPAGLVYFCGQWLESWFLRRL